MGVKPGLVGTVDTPDVTVNVMVTVGLTRGQRVAGARADPRPIEPYGVTDVAAERTVP